MNIRCLIFYPDSEPFEVMLPADYFPTQQSIDRFSEDDVNRQAVCEAIKVPKNIKLFEISFPINNGTGHANVTIYNPNYRP